ncbi:DUF938 domain-containing protein [Nannocystis sp. bb15-2]|uniref:DUF938 domain-containing protein n=2 Tax=Nannocystis bainbridge TaxID=2995303 RepID=A0ABT5DXH9_9BACT|nr:DUF938 domain-containing protein [Nannocystis bainbridge]MDC0718298.1 DUF938 domain-containing protein [Nannocystis bainbridge]
MQPHDPPPPQQSQVRSSPAALRNRGAIAEVLARVLPAEGRVLEIASGTGEHAVSFAAAFPGVSWQPTDVDPGALASIAARVISEGTPNLRAPLRLDVGAWPWPVEAAEAIVCINMIHIAPWSACEALMAGAGRVLPAGGLLFLYGPFKRGGQHTAPSNAAFDDDLRARDPAWGVRDEAVVRAAAATHGLQATELVAMPANNFSLVFRRG